MMVDWSETLTHKGSTLTGTFSPVQTGDDLSADGLLSTASATFVANADSYNAMSNKPGVRDTVTIDGSLYYVLDVLIDPACVTINVRKN